MKLKDDVTSTANIATTPQSKSDTTKRDSDKEKEKDMEVIKESDSYSISQNPGQRVFEIKNDYDYQVFRKGANSRDPRIWRGNDTCQEFMNDWNGNKSRSYAVRYNNADFYPANMGF